jgi:hypothetical protein
VALNVEAPGVLKVFVAVDTLQTMSNGVRPVNGLKDPL